MGEECVLTKALSWKGSGEVSKQEGGMGESGRNFFRRESEVVADTNTKLYML